MSRERWTPTEDEALRQLLQENLGAQFTEIAKKAVEPGGPFEDRTFWAVMGRLSLITGRTTPRKRETPKKDDELEALREENAELKTRLFEALTEKETLRSIIDEIRILANMHKEETK